MGKLGYVDDSFESAIKKIKKPYLRFGIDLSDRQASKIMADLIQNLEFDVRVKSRKRMNKFEILLR
jgi:hypothetical protein